MREWVANVWVWNFQWRRRLFEWENEEVERLTTVVRQNPPVRDKNDGIGWMGHDSLKFPIKEITEKVYDSRSPILPGPVTSFI